MFLPAVQRIAIPGRRLSEGVPGGEGARVYVNEPQTNFGTETLTGAQVTGPASRWCIWAPGIWSLVVP